MKKTNSQIILYPGFRLNYYSFYLAGLSFAFPDAKIQISKKGFPELHHHCLAFILSGRKERKIYISSGDGPGINETGLEWCDVYGKVNYDPDSIPSAYGEKILPLGPSFGVRIFSRPETIAHALRMYVTRGPGALPARRHFGDCYAQLKRPRLNDYEPGKVRDNYIFFAGSLWKKETEVNSSRAAFVKACKNTVVEFEGGFAPRPQNDIPGFSEMTMPRRYTMEEYIVRVKASTVVFNTPAVQNCIGWKLAEFLALGKAIISTPIPRKLPVPLVHGEHIHFVEGSYKSNKSAIAEILGNESYRKKLESGARRYFLEHLHPRKVIEKLVSAANG